MIKVSLATLLMGVKIIITTMVLMLMLMKLTALINVGDDNYVDIHEDELNYIPACELHSVKSFINNGDGEDVSAKLSSSYLGKFPNLFRSRKGLNEENSGKETTESSI